MTNDFYRTENFNINNSSFGGIIYPLDYETDRYNGRNIASRIASDWKFDEWCKKNSKARDEKQKIKKGNTDEQTNLSKI